MEIISAYDLSLRPSLPHCDVFFALNGNKDIDIVDVFRMNGYRRMNDDDQLRILTTHGWRRWTTVIQKCNGIVDGYNNYAAEKRYYEEGNLISNKYKLTPKQINAAALNAAGRWAMIDYVNRAVLNATTSCKLEFLKKYDMYVSLQWYIPKRIIAALRYMRMCILGAKDYGEEGKKDVEIVYNLYDDLIHPKQKGGD